MANTTESSSPIKIPSWLKSIPSAPTYHPNLTEFQDPISYIFKIEKEASSYGICKIVPPLSLGSKKTVISNFNRSLTERIKGKKGLNSKITPTFTTLEQHIGKSGLGKKDVWQSGEEYGFKEFETKAKKFEKSYWKRIDKEEISDLEIEALYWKAWKEKPFLVEYASDLPGSAFVPISEKRMREAGEPMTVGETNWNMRGVARAKGSLLKFMKEDIPGVTSPMMYLSMLYSWFGWHVEDHDLHSLNYIHTGAGKTWYGVPKEAALAFEEVIRVHEYGGEVNPLVSCATLAEKTTVMSPEVLLNAGVPCCRLVQNDGEIVVTFPRAYCSGVSHGFSCSEDVNIATPEWLMVARMAAIRRASMNYPPLLSHFQLLYANALSLYSRTPLSINTEPRSSRLKEKKRGEGETMVKELFVQDVIQNNELLHALLQQGSSCVLLPQKSTGENGLESGYSQIGGILDDEMFSCVQCGVSNFPCAAVIQPTEAASQYFTNADCSLFQGSMVGSENRNGEYTDGVSIAHTSEVKPRSGRPEKKHTGEASRGLPSLALLTAAYGDPSDSEDENVEAADDVLSSASNDSMSEIDKEANKSSGTNLQKKSLLKEDDDSSKQHIFCLEHALDAVKQLRSLGGTHVLLLCHPDYPKVETEAKMLAEEQGIDYFWNEISFRGFRNDDEARIQSALMVEEAVPGDTDWTVKMGINLSYSASLYQSPHYKIQDQYDANFFKAFGFTSLISKPSNNLSGKKSTIAGKWCGKAWKATQVHPYLIQNDAPSKPKTAAELSDESEPPVIKRYERRKKAQLNEKPAKKPTFFREESPSLIESEEELASQRSEESPIQSDEEEQSPTRKKKLLRNVPRKSTVNKPATKPKYFRGDSPGATDSEDESPIHNSSEDDSPVESEDEQPLVPSRKKNVSTIATRKSYRKRKKGTVNNKATKKPKYFKEDSPSPIESEDDSEDRPLLTRRPKTKGKGSINNKVTKKPKYFQADSPSASPNESEEEEKSPVQSPVESEDNSNSHIQNSEEEEEEESNPNVRRSGRIKNKKKSQNKNKDKSIWHYDDPTEEIKKKPNKKAYVAPSSHNKKYKTINEVDERFKCDLDDCKMGFGSKNDLMQHKRNVCVVEGCGKKFFSHKYLVQHRRVHIDDRPLKCPWKGCTMSFKWAWARTEHIRVHTGVRPYECLEPGCGQTFRFVTDFSRHRRKTGHTERKKTTTS